MELSSIPVGIMGEIHRGIPITEENRATIFVDGATDVAELEHYMFSNYIEKGVRAVLFGVYNDGIPRYAVFVQSGFLRNTDGD